MARQLPMRQRIRKALVIIAFLSFPVTMNFLSPYVIIDGAMNGVVNGSLIMFGLMFLSSLFFGRLWCGWICPGAGIVRRGDFAGGESWRSVPAHDRRPAARQEGPTRHGW